MNLKNTFNDPDYFIIISTDRRDLKSTLRWRGGVEVLTPKMKDPCWEKNSPLFNNS